jgi:hypothetical protein
MACGVVSEIVGSGISKNDPVMRHLSLQVLEYLLANGLMIAGDVTKKGFVPWPEQPLEALALIKKEWSSLSTLPTLGEICWLDLTDKGTVLAKSLAARSQTNGAA